VVTFLFHHFLTPEDVTWLGQFADLGLTEEESRALVFVREVGAMNNSAFRDINRGIDTLTASGHLRRLRDAGLLEQKGKSVGTYYVPTSRLLSGGARSAGLPDHLPPTFTKPESQPKQAVTTNLVPGTAPIEILPEPRMLGDSKHPLPRGLQEKPRGLVQTPGAIPAQVQEAIQNLGQRAANHTLKAAIIQICAWRPHSADDLSKMLGRNKSYLAHTYLGPMIRDGELEYAIPNQPAHPQQAYKAKS
jgi:ATP-dependent DNA helicase RecG